MENGNSVAATQDDEDKDLAVGVDPTMLTDDQ